MKQVNDNIKNVAVIGIGTQGSMIAFRNAIHGKQVIGYSRTQASVDKCRSKIKKWLEFYVQTGRLSDGEAAAAEQRITYASSLEEACRNAQLVVENVPEKLETKQEIFRRLDACCPPDTLLNSNTSSLLMTDIYACLSPERKSLTFSVDHDDPVRNDYLEMMWNPATSEDTKKAAVAHYRTLGFEPIITEREIKGYSINRVWRAVKRECLFLWSQGYITPSEFDRGWKMEWHTNIGPFQLMDLIGLDTVYAIENSYFDASQDERDRPPKKLKDLIDSGCLGMKSGGGFYTGYDTETGNIQGFDDRSSQ